MCNALLAGAFILSAFYFLTNPESVYAESKEQASIVESVDIVSSTIKTGERTVCLDGTEMAEKSLTLTVRSEPGQESVVESRRWWEMTGKGCGASDPKIEIELPAANDQMKTMIAKDHRGRQSLAAGQLKVDPYCSNVCSYVQGRYECWYGDRYWIDYCFNECNQYTGQYQYTDIGSCN